MPYSLKRQHVEKAAHLAPRVESQTVSEAVALSQENKSLIMNLVDTKAGEMSFKWVIN